MKKLFQYLGEAKLWVLVILVLLVIQAYCDLALPQYTSDIVDIGIQQGGIAHVAPEVMRPQTMEDLNLFLPEEQEKAVSGAYGLNADGNYTLTARSKKDLEQLDGLLRGPVAALSAAEDAGMLASLREAAAAGTVAREQLFEQADAALKNAGDNESLATQRALAFVRNEYAALGMDTGAYQTRYLLKTGCKMLGLTVCMIAASILAGMLGAYMAARIGKNLRSRVFKKVVSFSSGETDQFSTASLITRCTNDIQQVQMAMVMMVRFVFYAPIIGLGGIIKVAGSRTGMSWVIALAVGVVILVVGVLMSLAMPRFKRMQILVDRLNLVSREILTGIPVIRAFSRERHEEKRFAAANQELMSTQLFTNRVMSFMMPSMMLIMNGVTALIVWLGASGIDMGRLQVGDMMAFMTYTMQIIMSFLMITMVSVMLPRAGVAANRIEEVLDTEVSIHDKPQTQTREHWNGTVAFEDVSFRYPGAKGNTLEHISFTAKPGETTAIIGSTGCGKSTLIHLIPRFYDVTEGQITVDGVDVRDLPQKELRRLLGFVPQKGMLFSGDIASNLKFGGDDIPDSAMMEAAEIAQASDFIRQKAGGYHSPIAEGGTNVSGGQKQRLSIARAIAGNPKIFLFDDSFSALDYKTDVVLRKALNEKLSDATVIIVAQRISTILHANRIIVLDEGKIAGTGTHEELMENCEAYREIARSQLSEKELGGGAA